MSPLRLVSIFWVVLLTTTGKPFFAQRTDEAREIAGIEKTAREKAVKWDRESIEAAISDFIQAANRWRELSDKTNEAINLESVAELFLLIGKKDEANEFFHKALNSTVESNKTRRVSILAALSTIAIEAGDKKKSQRYLSTINQVSENDLDNSAVAQKLYAFGEFAYYDRRIKEAISFYQKAILIWRRENNLRKEANVLRLLGYAYMTDSDYDEALVTMHEALSKFEQSGDKRGEAFAHIAIGHILTSVDRKQNALDSYKRAELIFPPNLDLVEKARMSNGIGTVYEDLGDWSSSLTYREEALKLFKIERHFYGELATLPSIAKLKYLLGNDQEALLLLKRANNLATRLDDRLSLSDIKQALGDYYFKKKLFKAARENYAATLSYLVKFGYKKDVGMITNKQGRMYFLENSNLSARHTLIRALSISSEIKNPITQSDILYNLADLDKSENKILDAIDNIKESIHITESLYTDVYNSQLKTTYFSNVYDRYELYINLLMRMVKERPSEDFSVQALQASERARARQMLENILLSEAGFAKDAPLEMVQSEKELAGQLNAKRSKLTELLSSNAAKDEIRAIEDDAREIENKLDDIRATLKQTSPIYSAVKNPEPFDVGDFQANVLGEGDLLLEFSLGKEESYLWAVDKRDVTAYYLPPREQIEARVEKLRGLLGSRQLREGESFEDYQRRVADAEIEYKTEARILSSELLGQVAADKLAGKKLIIVADGRLHYFPLGSLPMPNSESDDPILLNQEVVYEPSASALKIFKMEKKAEARPQKDLLVFADPVFSKSDERIAGLDTSNQGFVATVLSTFRSIESLESMPRLPASREEAKSISDVVGANQTTVRAGFAANRDGVLSGGIEDYKILHFATHGLIDEKRPELSGILLSLFNDEGKRRDGGFIRLQDVYGLRLNSDLVVLSACDTGIGKEVKGEGVMSLNNAFLQAGAKSVVSSLWKVDDTATKDLMTEFYRGMADDNLTAAAALRQAQIKMHNDPRYRSPFYWAAFTASGDAGVRVAFTSYAWLYAVIATAAITASILAFLAFRHRTLRGLPLYLRKGLPFR